VLIDLILIGLAMAFYPVALTIFILILASAHGPRKGAGFIFGWLAALAVVATVTIVATGNKPPAAGTAPSIGILVVKIVLGVVLLGVAERQRRKIGKPRQQKEEPRWQARIDEMSPLFAIGLGAFFQPSVFVVTAVATITGAKLSSAASYLSLVLFGLLSVSTFLAMDVFALARPERSDVVLSNLKAWIDRHSDLIIVIVAAVVGLWLIGKSSYLLAT
jgi:Sap-like sulfolipid-1-addressing protein